MIILAIAAILVACVGIGAVIYARWNYGVLESLNIPVDNVSFLFGSTGDMHLRVQHFQDLDRFRKYGGIYGVYEGRAAHVHVCDPELIKLIFVKDVDHFQDRRAVDLGHPLMNEMMDFLPYKKWKAVRQATTPAFTASKIKQMMTESVQGCVTEFINYISSQAEGQDGGQRLRIDCRKTFMPFMLDLTARSLFGVNLEDPYNYENKFTKAFRQLQGEDFPLSQLYSWSFTFPALTLLAPFMSPSTVDYLHRFFRQLAKSTTTDPDESFWGRLQHMLKKLESQEFKELSISETTVLAQAFNGFIAGFDALTSTVSFFCYHVASNPEIQEKLVAEINALGETGDELSYAAKLPYMQACIKETLRLIPPFIRSERLCTKDWQFGNIRINKGCVVILPSWAANRNPQVYSHPDEFKPERFLKDGASEVAPNPYGFTSFGFGPRNCIGEKFALDALKLTCANLIREFGVELCPDTEIEYKPGVVWFIKYKPIYLTLVKRA